MNTLTIIPTLFSLVDANGSRQSIGDTHGFRVEVGDYQGFYSFRNIQAYRKLVADSLKDASNLFAFLELQFPNILGAFLETADTDLHVDLKGIATFKMNLDDKGYFLVPVVA